MRERCRGRARVRRRRDVRGEKTCERCHPAQDRHFANTLHAKVFRENPRTFLERQTCEACHGPGSNHVANPGDHSALIGVRVLFVETASWLLTGAFAGVCGIFLANFVRLQAILLTFLVISAIAAALIGRLSSLWLTALAGLAIGLVESLLTAWPEVAPYRSASPYIIALVAVALSGRAAAIVTEER